MHFYGSIQKVDAEQRMVYGYASTEATDGHGEVVLKSAIEDALDDYLEFANIREMHQLSAVGTAEEASVDDKGLWIGAKIVDDTAWGKVTSGVYKGFSIGGKTLARDPDNKKVITKIALNEISLVDRPSNPEARFDVWKAAGADPTDKVRQSDNGLDIITKALRDRDDEIDRLNKRIEELLVEPMPPKTVGLFAISKDEDAGGTGLRKRQASEDDLVAALGALSEEDRAMLLIKAAQQLPRPVIMSRPAE